ncbi:MAG: GlsB/YeaQ/YmgE family stress response membrane protein [Chloroflexi bacterium]|nr:GlsB/YeaQ/YmgE family stress response membrane protein [Chloroflexota bacterium]
MADSIMNDQITITITVEQLLAWIIIGLLAGLIASMFVRGRISLFGLLFVGLLGAVVGGFVFFDLLEVQPSPELVDGILIRWIDIIVSVVGALLVMAATSLFYWRRV